MLKLAGIILVSAAISFAGFHKALKIKDGIRTRRALLEFVLYVKRNIEASSSELSEIYKSYHDEALQKTGFLQILTSQDGNTLEYALKDSALQLPDSLSEIYLNLSRTLGKSRSAKTETENLARYICAIEAEEAKLIKNDETKLMLYRKLGLLSGILAALILI